MYPRPIDWAAVLLTLDGIVPLRDVVAWNGSSEKATEDLSARYRASSDPEARDTLLDALRGLHRTALVTRLAEEGRCKVSVVKTARRSPAYYVRIYGATNSQFAAYVKTVGGIPGSVSEGWAFLVPLAERETLWSALRAALPGALANGKRIA